jgi:hypothetical protein
MHMANGRSSWNLIRHRTLRWLSILVRFGARAGQPNRHRRPSQRSRHHRGADEVRANHGTSTCISLPPRIIMQFPNGAKMMWQSRAARGRAHRQ